MLYDAEVNAAVVQAGNLYAVAPDSALVQAIIEKETRHRPYSTQGTLEPNGHRSYGPMQVEDITAARHGIADPSTLNVASIGIRIGTFELARLLSAYPGDAERAVAAYNAGQGNAYRDDVSGDFPNQSYVDEVMGFWDQYRVPITVAASAVLPLVLGGILLLFLLPRRRRRLA